MTEVAVRLLDESEWELYREVRLRALAESPESFAARLDEEAERDEQYWRKRMTRAYRLLAGPDSAPQGIVSLGVYEPEPESAECYGLYVVPDARGLGVAWHLVEAAARLAAEQGNRRLYYWVGTDNPRAIGFANNFGFRITGRRRPARPTDLDHGEAEVAMVLSLAPDTRSAPNPTQGRATVRQGPTE